MQEAQYDRHRFGSYVRERYSRTQRGAAVFPGLLCLREARCWSSHEGHKWNYRRLQASRMFLGNM